MSSTDRKIIYILLIVIIIGSSILIYKINSEPKYDIALYNEIYDEYNEILTNIEEQKVENNSNNSNGKIYMISNSKGKTCRVVGKISIPKININYPIIYETTDEYLKIAPTKLAGPDINTIGNFCIIGHNYYNNDFFSNLSDLENKDRINLMDNEGKSLSYEVYNKYIISEDDLSCMNQETQGNIEATLITCTKNKKQRLVLKCRAI